MAHWVLSGPQTGAYGINAGAAQVPDCFVALVRYDNKVQLSGARKACQGERIAAVCLHPIARPTRYLRGRHLYGALHVVRRAKARNAGYCGRQTF